MSDHKYGEVIDVGDQTSVYYLGKLAIGAGEAIPHLHVVALQTGDDNSDHRGASRIYCDVCGSVWPMKVNSCPNGCADNPPLFGGGWDGWDYGGGVDADFPKSELPYMKGREQ